MSPRNTHPQTRWEAAGWKQERCGYCGGHEVVSDYGGGEDFYGPKGCDYCHENGFVWRSPKDRLAVYPGGPFVGYDPPRKSGPSNA